MGHECEVEQRVTRRTLAEDEGQDHDRRQSDQHRIRSSARSPVIGSTATDIGISEDRRAFTINFADLSFDIDRTALDGRLIGIVVPLADAGPESTITFSVSGFAEVGTGCSATLWLRAGDQSSKLVSIPVGRNGSYVEQMTYVPTPGQTEVHLTVALLVERSGEAAEQAPAAAAAT